MTHRTKYDGPMLYPCVFLMSLSLLMLEIGLTRVFSVMFESHYAFLVISLAILGLGLGGIFVHIRMGTDGDFDRDLLHLYSALSSGTMALSILLMQILIVRVPLFQNLAITALATPVPFFWGGMFLAAAFRILPHKSPHIYAADLLGAAAGSILAVAMLSLGAIGSNLFAALAASLPAFFYALKASFPKFSRYALLTLPLIILVLLIAETSGLSLGTVPFAKNAHKEMAVALGLPEGKAHVAESRWSAFGRTDLVEANDKPDEKGLFIDGTAGTAMYRFNKDIKSLRGSELENFSAYFPFETMAENEKEKVLIIGPGGGREVLVSLLGGAKEITAVEVNRDLVELMKKNSAFNGGIYDGFKGVKIVAEEGRSFVRSAKEYYDIIIMSIPVTKTSRSPEGFALTENFLFTVESINDYLDRLKDNGRLIVVAHEDMEIYRLVFTALAALRKRGIDETEAMKHIYTAGPDAFPLFVLKKTPLTRQEADKVHRHMHRRNYTALSSFIPFVKQENHYIPLGEKIYLKHPMLSDTLYLIAQGKTSSGKLLESVDMDIKAVSDDRPFFYKFEAGLPAVLTILLSLSGLAMLGGWFIKPGYLMEGDAPARNFILLFIFSLLGVGFMLMEIPLIQKFMLFLGQPVYAVAALLFSLLAGSGAGSWLSGYIRPASTVMKLRLSAAAISLLGLFYIFALDRILASLLGVPFSVKILTSFCLIFPLGLFLGMPFPMTMKLLDELGMGRHVPRMWGVNGIGSVLGSALAVSMAVSFGLSYAYMLGIMLYGLLLLLYSFTLDRGEPSCHG